MSFYQVNLAVFIAGNAYLLHKQYRSGQQVEEQGQHERLDDGEPNHDDDLGVEASQDGGLVQHAADQSQGAVRKFMIDFLSVYALAVAADWLQGPHIYAIYKYEKGLSERTVAALYAGGFISGALSASFAGELADRYGRRLACLVYCAAYAATCLTMLSDNLIVLLAGRLCGGVSTTLLFSVFEAWMITEYHRRGLDEAGRLPLGTLFGYMTTLSCVVAIASGVVGDVLVAYFGSRVYPFLASIVCCGAAAWLIHKTWRENYGAKSANKGAVADLKASVLSIIHNSHVVALGITSCFFEGAMYLFIFFWSAALKHARVQTRAKTGQAQKGEEEEDLPYGLISASFMCAMMAGSALFSLSPLGGGGSSNNSSNNNGAGTERRETRMAYLLMGVMVVVSGCFSLATVLEDERLLFWTLCVIEFCIGAYFPSMSSLKSDVVEDGVRGRVYSVLRFPLNVFVVIVHSLDEEGAAHRNNVFTLLAALLLVAFVVVNRCFANKD